MDGLDECPNPSVVRSPRAKVLSLIEELITTQILNLRICATSRPELDIKNVLNPLIFRSVSLHDENGQNRDIEDYIKSVINTPLRARAGPHCHFPAFFLSPAIDVKELETLLRKPAHTEEGCARIVGSCNSLEYH